MDKDPQAVCKRTYSQSNAAAFSMKKSKDKKWPHIADNGNVAELMSVLNAGLSSGENVLVPDSNDSNNPIVNEGSGSGQGNDSDPTTSSSGNEQQESSSNNAGSSSNTNDSNTMDYMQRDWFVNIICLEVLYYLLKHK